MRPRNVLTETNNMRKLMGLPLLNEDTGKTAEDVKKKVLTEDRSFSLGFANNGGLTLAEDDIDPMEDNVMQEETIDETTEAEETEEEGVGAPVNDVVEEQDEFGDGPLGIETGIDVGNPQPGDGEGGLGLNTDAQVFAEGSFAKYNITRENEDTKQNINEGWFDGEKKKDELEGYEPLTGLAELKDEARRIISFLTPGEGDEIEGKYMENIYPAMALKTAQILHNKIEKMM